MNSDTIFRASVVSSPVIGMMAMGYAILATPSFSQEWQDLITWSGDSMFFPDPKDDEFTLPHIICLLLAIAYTLVAIANQVALYFFWPPSRHIYFAVWLIGIAVTPLFGLTVEPPLESFGYELSTFIAGITLALAYLSPVAGRFKKPEDRTKQSSPSA